MARNVIGSRQWMHNNPEVWYVASLIGEGRRGGKGDWGYTTDASKALPLSPYWARRFNADCRRVGYVAHFREV